jgi:hypothetical protein
VKKTANQTREEWKKFLQEEQEKMNLFLIEKNPRLWMQREILRAKTCEFNSLFKRDNRTKELEFRPQ